MSVDDWDDYESGPFCVHWDEASCCRLPCRCGHECRRHFPECDADGCDCIGFDGASE